MADNEVKSHCESNKLSIKQAQTYKKRPGTSGADGHFLEISLLTLCKLRGDQKLKDFYLAGNLESAGDFDDVVFRYKDANNRENVIFLQSKFKQNRNQKITINTFETNNDWPLQKYFKSFTQIQDEFSKSGSNDPIFGGKKDHLNCYFVIYTNANRHDDMKEHADEVENPLNFVLEEEYGQAFNLKVVKVEALLQGVQHDIEIELVLKHLKHISTAQCGRLKGDPNFKIYHTFFTQTVLVKDGGCWKYRNDFLESDFQNQVLKQFRKRAFSWYTEQIMGGKKSANSDDSSYEETIKHMKTVQLKLPPWFNNTMPKFETKLCDDFIKFVSPRISNNICTVTYMSKNSIKEVSRFVGNVLVFDECKAMFKFNTGQIDEEPRKILQYLTEGLKKRNIDTRLHFNIQVEKFPRLSLGFTQLDSKKVREFAEKLAILTGQPNVNDLKNIIENFGNLNDKQVGRHHLIIGKMINWWKQLERTEYLKNDDGFFEGILNGILFKLGNPIQSFTGRATELEILHSALQNNESGESIAVISQMASVSGLGGIGKSELARQYAHVHGHIYDGNIIWIDAETRYSMQNCFLVLCKDYLNIQTQDANNKEIEIETIVQRVYNFFKDRKSLFIFDNAQYFKHNSAQNDNINDFLPKKQEGINAPHFLITSRNQEWQCTVKIELSVLQDVEAEQLVKGSLRIMDDQQDNDVKELIEQLHNFPLALQQAIAYIRQKRIEYLKTLGKQFKISDYLKLYNDKAKKLLDFQFPNDCIDKYTQTTFMTWNITLAEIEKSDIGTDAREIFNIMAYLNPNDIPVKFFAEIVNNNLEKLTEVFVLIEKYSMITLRNGLANIHRLVQNVTQIMLQDNGKQHPVLKTALSIIRNHTDHQLITQGAPVWYNASKYDDLVTHFSTVPAKIIDALRDTLRYEEASAFGKVSLESLKSTIGLDHAATASAQCELARTLLKQGKYEDALSSYKAVLEKAIKILGPDHPSTLTIQHDIALVLLEQGQYEESLTINKEILEKRTNLYGRDHKATLTTQHNIANTLCRMFQYEDALKSYKEVFEIATRILGPDHESTLTIQHNIAQVLLQQGHYKDALSSYQEVLEKTIKTLGPDHPDTLSTQHNIAFILSKQGQNEVALSCFKEILKKRVNLLGPDHPATLNTEYNIAVILSEQGQYDDALCSSKEILQKMTKVLGPNHPKTLIVANYIAKTLSKQGQYEEALNYHKDVLEKKTKVLETNNPSSLKTQNELASELSQQRPNKSLKSYIQDFLKFKSIFRLDHLCVLIILALLRMLQAQFND